MTDPHEQFSARWAELAGIGLGPAGYERFAWTPADRALRDWFRSSAGQRGMAVEQDRNGNLWAWLGEPGPGSVVTGSHLDSVPGGGAYDGPLGIVSAFLAVDALRAQGHRPVRPLAVVAFADEEGARFGVACVGSRLLTGLLDPAAARDLRDAEGVSLADAVREAGVDPDGLGRDEQALARIGVFVELHVEQGRGLADLGAAVGLGTAIWPHGRWRLRFSGEPNHAGTTRLGDRHDPMLPFAETVLAVRRAAAEASALATVGKVRVRPNGVNAIAAEVHGWLDARAADEATLTALVAEVSRAAERAAAAHGVSVEVRQESRTPVVAFPAPLRDRLQGVLGDIPELPTGAGHDAGVLSAQVPSAMLFVRNPSGTSHSPAEHAEVADCVAGVQALACVLQELACR